MLTKQNTGIYLTGEWNDPDRERQQCLHDSRNFSAADKTKYGVTDTGVSDGQGYQIDNACIMDTNPIDPDATPKTIDRRTLPEVG